MRVGLLSGEDAEQFQQFGHNFGDVQRDRGHFLDLPVSRFDQRCRQDSRMAGIDGSQRHVIGGKFESLLGRHVQLDGNFGHRVGLGTRVVGRVVRLFVFLIRTVLGRQAVRVPGTVLRRHAFHQSGADDHQNEEGLIELKWKYLVKIFVSWCFNLMEF